MGACGARMILIAKNAPKSHECSDALDLTYTPGSEPEQRELFEAKQAFMFMYLMPIF